jgi:hypothetical protein
VCARACARVCVRVRVYVRVCVCAVSEATQSLSPTDPLKLNVVSRSKS